MNRFSISVIRSYFPLALASFALAYANIALGCDRCGCCRIPVSGELEVGQGYAQGIADAGPLPITPGSWTLAILPDTQH